MDSLFLKACRCEPVSRVPIWLMRQAGRYLPEYRAIRKRYNFLQMVKTPELAVEITLQPLRRFEPDAAIIFADILPLLESMGLELEFISNKGPVFHQPVRHREEIDKLNPLSAHELEFTLNALKLARKEIKNHIPLIGFSGAPFTLACYAVEGKGTPGFPCALDFMRTENDAWEKLLKKISEAINIYLLNQVKAGADVLQLFDSWAGLLTSQQFEQYVKSVLHPLMTGLKNKCKTPLIYFSTRTGNLLSQLNTLQCDVIGIDHTTDLQKACRTINTQTAVQGNLSPHALLEEKKFLLAKAEQILKILSGRPGGIFNLGHGVLKETNPEQVKLLVDFVKNKGVV